VVRARGGSVRLVKFGRRRHCCAPANFLHLVKKTLCSVSRQELAPEAERGPVNHSSRTWPTRESISRPVTAVSRVHSVADHWRCSVDCSCVCPEGDSPAPNSLNPRGVDPAVVHCLVVLRRMGRAGRCGWGSRARLSHYYYYAAASSATTWGQIWGWARWTAQLLPLTARFIRGDCTLVMLTAALYFN
jgi:hypothetical protein